MLYFTCNLIKLHFLFKHDMKHIEHLQVHYCTMKTKYNFNNYYILTI